MIPEDAPPRWVENTRYYRRRVRSPEWWRSLPPERRLAELRRSTRRLRTWVWAANFYLAVLVLCLVALAGFFVDPSVASVLSGVALMIVLVGVVLLMLRVRRRCRQSLGRATALLRQVELDPTRNPPR